MTSLHPSDILTSHRNPVQEISVNTGIIDRWLHLNTVLFSTAASSALPMFGMTGISFRSVNSRHVLRALQRTGDRPS